MYLNEIPYGSTAYGIEAASQKYFGKSVQDIKDRKSTRLNSSHTDISRMPSSA